MNYDLITIVGPTASGKTRLAAALAARADAEIISGDSRQVYRRMDLGTGKDLADYEVDRLDIETKYILAVSYARSESFKKEEISNIIDKLSQASSEQEMEYWIYLGRNQLAEAQNTALTLSDDKLLIYAYMKEIDAVENDIQMDGNTKQERLTQLQNSIESIGKKYITDAKKDEEK